MQSQILSSALWQNIYLLDEFGSCKVKITDRSPTLSMKNVVSDYLKCKLQTLDDILGFLSLEVLERTPYYPERKTKANPVQTSGFRCQFVRDVENMDTCRPIPRVNNQKNSKPWEI